MSTPPLPGSPPPPVPPGGPPPELNRTSGVGLVVLLVGVGWLCCGGCLVGGPLFGDYLFGSKGGGLGRFTAEIRIGVLLLGVSAMMLVVGGVMVALGRRRR